MKRRELHPSSPTARLIRGMPPELAKRTLALSGFELPELATDPSPAPAPKSTSAHVANGGGRKPELQRTPPGVLSQKPRVSVRPMQATPESPKAKALARRKARAERDHARELHMLDTLKGRITAAGGDTGEAAERAASIQGIKSATWRMAWAVVGDATGRAARLYLAHLRNRHAAAAIELAALGNGARHWSSLRARRVAALGLAMLTLARRTRRRGQYDSLIMGIPRGALCSMLHDPNDPRPEDASGKRPGTPHVTTVFGVHRAGAAALGLDEAGGDIGYFVALRLAGFAYRQQLPPHLAERCELWGPSGYATSRYWVCAAHGEGGDHEATLAALRVALGLAGPPEDPSRLPPPD